MKLLVDIQGGHKTGYYLDQRDSRLATRRYVENQRVLNCFSYTGGFAVSALMGGCRQVISVDTSQKRWILRNRTLNSTNSISARQNLSVTMSLNCYEPIAIVAKSLMSS